MKKEYKGPELIIVFFESEDVVTVSYGVDVEFPDEWNVGDWA